MKLPCESSVPISDTIVIVSLAIECKLDGQ